VFRTFICIGTAGFRETDAGAHPMGGGAAIGRMAGEAAEGGLATPFRWGNHANADIQCRLARDLRSLVKSATIGFIKG